MPSSGGLLPPSPPREKITARQDQAGKASAGDGTGGMHNELDIVDADKKWILEIFSNVKWFEPMVIEPVEKRTLPKPSTIVNPPSFGRDQAPTSKLLRTTVLSLEAVRKSPKRKGRYNYHRRRL